MPTAGSSSASRARRHQANQASAGNPADERRFHPPRVAGTAMPNWEGLALRLAARRIAPIFARRGRIDWREGVEVTPFLSDSPRPLNVSRGLHPRSFLSRGAALYAASETTRARASAEGGCSRDALRQTETGCHSPVLQRHFARPRSTLVPANVQTPCSQIGARCFRP